jgi:hypothetical protein
MDRKKFDQSELEHHSTECASADACLPIARDVILAAKRNARS